MESLYDYLNTHKIDYSDFKWLYNGFRKATTDGDIGSVLSIMIGDKASLINFANALYYAEVIIKTQPEEEEFNEIKKFLENYIKSINNLQQQGQEKGYRPR